MQMAILREKGHRQICVLRMPKSMDYLPQMVVVEENGRVFKDRSLRNVRGHQQEKADADGLKRHGRLEAYQAFLDTWTTKTKSKVR